MSSRTDRPTHPAGGPRAHRAPAFRKAGTQAPAAVTAAEEKGDAAHLDGLFTYCLAILHDHDLAHAALAEVVALATRHGSRPARGPAGRRAWLYALARWVCRRELAQAEAGRAPAHAAGHTTPAGGPDAAGPGGHHRDPDRRRAAELARLAWPEAAGTSPEQREALELSVRHGLTTEEIAAVLGADPGATRALLAAAFCEVERTRAALSVVERGTCPSVARLTGDRRVLLSAALRTELVRHVDDCPRCRRAAERAEAAAPWPGTARPVPGPLPLVAPDRSALAAAFPAGARPYRVVRTSPRFNRAGFPMDPRDRAARRERMRARAVTTTLVATVVAAPVLALWAAYRGAPLTGEAQDGRPVAASESGDPDVTHGPGADGHYENTGSTRPTDRPDVSVEVTAPGVPPEGPDQGALTVDARHTRGGTLVTLTATGGTSVDWSARAGSAWLGLSRTSGTLAPGETVTLRVFVHAEREPRGHWSARIAIGPHGAVVTVRGHGGTPGRPGPPGTAPPGTGAPGPTDPGTPRPTDPGPSDPGPTDPGPTDPEPSDPGPIPSAPDPTEPDPPDPGPTDPGDGETGG
ncbi:sigma factor-like helix-turn-helix DNA-binding protein [Streptomyces diastaticus]|uniref:sigma factor-like helix-turn-helix DNA-binding protein n=1 Tax=Streptomyces diastaticus TaxID=1956 RepID=UPI003651C857